MAHRSLTDRVARRILSPALRDAVERLDLRDEGHGIDRFGLSRDGAARGLAVTRFLYERWFRVVSHGIEHIPDGRVVLAANHSGTLPVDALMLAHDLARNRGRVARIAMDWFVPGLPWVNLLFVRAGGFGGTRGNFHALLEADELLLAFPEGVPGIGKPFSERYILQDWRPGHAELAIAHGAPIIPVAVIGAEEQLPQLARIEGVHVLGSPYLPIPATPLPLPVRIHLWYGEPIDVSSRYPRSAAGDAAAVHELAERVALAVRGLIARGLAERNGVFR